MFETSIERKEFFDSLLTDKRITKLKGMKRWDRRDQMYNYVIAEAAKRKMSLSKEQAVHLAVLAENKMEEAI